MTSRRDYDEFGRGDRRTKVVDQMNCVIGREMAQCR
jgi:hypothetical protein